MGFEASIDGVSAELCQRPALAEGNCVKSSRSMDGENRARLLVVASGIAWRLEGRKPLMTGAKLTVPHRIAL